MKKSLPHNLKKIIISMLVFFSISAGMQAQSIFANTITRSSPNFPDIDNPYIFGQTFNPNLTVSGIGRGMSTVSGINTNNRYNATNWATTATIDTNKYFEFTLTPNSGYKIDFSSLVFNYTISGNGPNSFGIRSSLDGYASNITTFTGVRGGAALQNVNLTALNLAVNTPITFRIYGWNALLASGSFSIDDFDFTGVIRIPCTFSGGTLTQLGANQTICFDTPPTTAGTTPAYLSLASYLAGNYVVLNVIKGFNYTFAVTDAFSGSSPGTETLSVFDDANPAGATLAGNTGSTGTSVTWTSTLSGKVRILLSKGACIHDNSSGPGTLTIALNSLGNTQDSQTAVGTDSWVGHVYNFTGGTPPGGASPATPSTNVSPFLTTDYVGYYNETENFYQEFSGGGAAANAYCFPILSNALNLVNIYTNLFSVRYRMNSTKPAGCYVITLDADDGNRLYIDGALKDTDWSNHARNTRYNMFYLTGNNSFIYDYYEAGGQSKVGFDIKSLSSLNTVIQSTQYVCTPSTSFINGSSFTAYGFPAGTVTYQWQTSTSSTGPFVNCTGISTSEDYTVSPAVVATLVTGNVTNYYKRVVTSNANASCVYDSNVINITTSPATPATPGAITGTVTQCPTLTGQIYSITAVTNATTYTWTVPTGWSITAGAGTTSITVSTGTAGQNGNISVTAGNGCGTSVAKTLAVTVSLVTPATPGTITGTSIQCPSLTGQTYSITAVTNATTYTWTVPTGWSVTAGAGTTSIIVSTGTAGQNGNISVTAGNGCGTSAANTLAVTVGPAPSAPSITPTQPNCVTPTGTVTITPVAGETYSFDGGAYTGTLIYSGLAQGSSHTVYAKNALGCISLVTNVTVTSLLTNIWTTSWSLGTPTINQNIEFQGDYPPAIDPNVDINGCSCNINAGVTVTVKTGKTLTITNQLVTTGANLIFENNASLVQINDSPIPANTGNITYKRDTQPLLRYDYTYWSSPVAGQTLGTPGIVGVVGTGLSPTTLIDKYFSYDAQTTDNWKEMLRTDVMTVGTGYIVRAPQTYNITIPRATFTGVFVGIPHNGLKSIPIYGTDRNNLIGNPYPSAIDANTFLGAPNSSVIKGTIYFWTHNTQPASFLYTDNDYAAYNPLGGVATYRAPSGNTGGLNTSIPTGKIASGQAFFAESIVPGTVIFNNAMRIAGGVGGADNSQFFRMSNKNKKTTGIEKHRIWLNLSNTEGAFRQTLLGYTTDATNGLDNMYDGASISASAIDFYSINESKNLVIQGRALPFETSDQVPLGYSSTINGNFEISIDQADGLLTNQAIFLEDKLAGITHNLRDGAYNFNTIIGTFDNRFVLKYTNTTLATTDFDSKLNAVIVSVKNKQIKVNATTETIDKITVYDILGKRIYQKTNIGNNEFVISNLNSSESVLIVKTTLKNGQISSEKVIFE